MLQRFQPYLRNIETAASICVDLYKALLQLIFFLKSVHGQTAHELIELNGPATVIISWPYHRTNSVEPLPGSILIKSLKAKLQQPESLSEVRFERSVLHHRPVFSHFSAH
jgi:hypothetical protein